MLWGNLDRSTLHGDYYGLYPDVSLKLHALSWGLWMAIGLWGHWSWLCWKVGSKGLEIQWHSTCMASKHEGVSLILITPPAKERRWELTGRGRSLEAWPGRTYLPHGWAPPSASEMPWHEQLFFCHTPLSCCPALEAGNYELKFL